MPNAIATPTASYALPEILEGTGCVDNTWTATAGPADPRHSHTAVWTGSEMIVWGGQSGFSSYLSSGGKYNPSTDTWVATAAAGAPTPRVDHTAVWTGSEMIVWGGLDENFFRLDTGGKYDPRTNSWTPTSTTNAPEARNLNTAVWTGSEMIVWGGAGDLDLLDTGGRYNPNTDNWTVTSTTKFLYLLADLSTLRCGQAAK